MYVSLYVVLHIPLFLFGCGGVRTGDETLEEGLLAQVGVVLLEVLLGRGDELDGGELESVRGGGVSFRRGFRNLCSFFVPSLLEAADDLADDATLWTDPLARGSGMFANGLFLNPSYLDTVRLNSDEAVGTVRDMFAVRNSLTVSTHVCSEVMMSGCSSAFAFVVCEGRR